MKDSVNILGTIYTIKVKKEKDDDVLKRTDGYCDDSSKEIVLRKLTKKNCNLSNIEEYSKKVLRHEIIHAFLSESGLAESSGAVNAWATNEEMVDWIAYQAPKLHKAFTDSGCA